MTASLHTCLCLFFVSPRSRATRLELGVSTKAVWSFAFNRQVDVAIYYATGLAPTSKMSKLRIKTKGDDKKF